MLASEGGDALVFKVHCPWTHQRAEDERTVWILLKWMFAHRQDGQQLLDGQFWLQTLFEHADGLVFQVIVGCDAAVRQRLDGVIVLNKTRQSLINMTPVKIQPYWGQVKDDIPPAETEFIYMTSETAAVHLQRHKQYNRLSEQMH